MSAPLGHIPVHIRDGSAILLHSNPGYTITETLASPYSLLVSQASDGYAFGSVYLDDGESLPPTPSRTIKFSVSAGELRIESSGTYEVNPKLESVTILGAAEPSEVSVGDKGLSAQSWKYDGSKMELTVNGLSVDLNDATVIQWK